jgi:hypothetical protein
MFGWLGAFFGFIARFGPIVLLCAVCFLIACALALLGWVFGFTLDDVDAWLSAHSSWITAVADVLFRLGCFFVLVICAVVVVGAVHAKLRPGPRDLVGPPEVDREGDRPPGLGCAVVALIVGYLAFVGTFMRY